MAFLEPFTSLWNDPPTAGISIKKLATISKKFLDSHKRLKMEKNLQLEQYIMKLHFMYELKSACPG